MQLPERLTSEKLGKTPLQRKYTHFFGIPTVFGLTNTFPPWMTCLMRPTLCR